MKMKTTKGFTLTELLIVMAIIVVLAAVAIPTFGKQLETARETGDMEIVRNAYTEALGIAVLDAADGKLNGYIGDGSKDAHAAAAHATNDAAFIWGSVIWAGAGDDETISSVKYKTGKYKVSLNGTSSSTVPVKDMGAYFSQSSGAEATKWKYVSSQLMGVTVPSVNTGIKSLTFEFYIANDGSVKLVPDVTDNTANAITANSTV